MPDTQSTTHQNKQPDKSRIRLVEQETEQASASREQENAAASFQRVSHPATPPILPKDILNLQRTVGNKAVQRMLQDRDKRARRNHMPDQTLFPSPFQDAQSRPPLENGAHSSVQAQRDDELLLAPALLGASPTASPDLVSARSQSNHLHDVKSRPPLENGAHSSVQAQHDDELLFAPALLGAFPAADTDLASARPQPTHQTDWPAASLAPDTQRTREMRPERLMPDRQNSPNVQRSSGGKFAKAQIMGMNKTINPFFGWRGYYKALKDIYSGEDSDIKYGHWAFKVLNAMVATADRVASFATALTFILTVLGTILAPFYGAGAVILSIATITGIVATIAHAVTFLLRGLVTIYDLVRLRKAGKGSRERALLKGKMWANIGGLISNGIGVLMGGLGGGFIGGSNIIGGAMESVAGSGASLAGAGIGEGANRVADTAAAFGSIKQSGKEKHAPKHPVLQPDVVASVNDTSQVDTASSTEDATQTISGQVTSSSSESTQVGSSQEDRSEEIKQDLVEVKAAAVSSKQDFSDSSSEESKAEVSIAKATGKVGEALGESQKIADHSTEVSDSSENKMVEVNDKIKKSGAKPSSSVVKEAESKVVDLETVVDAGHESSSDSEGKEDAGSQQEEGASQSQEGASTEETTVRLKPAAVQRGFGDKVKGFASDLWGRFIGIGKRIKKVGKKVKLKMTQVMVKALGLTDDLKTMQVENHEAGADLPVAIAANQEGQATTESVKSQSQQAKALLDQSESGQ